MARIRTIKPGFFKHEELFDAELETGLPLRLAFAGLWTVCDREGRFKWRPRAIKTDVLPYDDLDFSRVLDALATRHFVLRYTVEGVDYGFVPGFSRHQAINGRESESEIPPPPQGLENDMRSTRQPRVDDASATRHDPARGEGKGREGEEEGKESSSSSAREREDDPSDQAEADRLYDEVLSISGHKNGRVPSRWMPPHGPRHVWRWRSDLGLSSSQIIDVVRAQRANHADPPDGPKAFDRAMQIYAADLKADPMKPIERGRPGQPPPADFDPEAYERRERARLERQEYVRRRNESLEDDRPPPRAAGGNA